MATFDIIKLHFTSALHLSDRRDDYGMSLKSLQSDTLYAALTACLAKTEEYLPADGDLGFTISSLFPYYQTTEGSTPVYFLPKPLQARLPEMKDAAMAKKIKKVQWIDSRLYAKVLRGESLLGDSDKYAGCIQSAYLTESALPADVEGGREFVRSEVFQRVEKEDRTGKDDALPYYFDRILFKDYSGLYFIVTGDTERLEKAMKLLALEGIGSDRNVGFGFFEFEKGTVDIDIPAEADFLVSLSLLIPETKDQLDTLLASDKVAYDFERRGGWITTAPHKPLRKNAIYGFLPGSVFCNIGKECIGRIVNLEPTIDGVSMTRHPVWRNGRSIMLPINLK